MEETFIRLHNEWIDNRRSDGAETGQMKVSEGIIAVACCLPSEADNGDRGLASIRNDVFKRAANRSYIPQSWVEAKGEIIEIGGQSDQAGDIEEVAQPLLRAWAMRDEIHKRFLVRVNKLDRNNPIRGLSDDAIHAAMEGALELR